MEDWRNALAAIRAKTGMRPNKAIIGPTVLGHLSRHPDIMDRMGFKYNRTGLLDLSQLAGVMEVPQILVGDPVFNSSVEGQTDSLADVWGKDCIFVVAPPTATRYQTSFGYLVTKIGQKPRRVFRNAQDSPPGSELLQVDDKYDQLITDDTAAFLIKDCVA